MKKTLVTLLLSAGLISVLNAETSTASTNKFVPAVVPVPVDQNAVKKWQDDRFGMFIHWGPVSLTGKEISWSRGRKNGTP
jgi:alpha-L-fucosidase